MLRATDLDYEDQIYIGNKLKKIRIIGKIKILKEIMFMTNVYVDCPIYQDNKYLLRLVANEDKKDLLKVYSDKEAVPFFNSDNCHGDDFYYTTESRMEEAVKYWLFEYQKQGFVRWSILDKEIDEIIGTIELFHRDAKDYFTNCGLLRLDLRSDYEKRKKIIEILSLILKPAFNLFNCDKIATKAINKAAERRKALEEIGFSLAKENLIGHDGTIYESYFAIEKNKLKVKEIF